MIRGMSGLDQPKEYGKLLILLGKKTDSKDLREPTSYTELYRTTVMSCMEVDEFIAKKRKYSLKGYILKTVEVKVEEELELGETLEVKITKSGLKPSPKGTLGCDFDI